MAVAVSAQAASAHPHMFVDAQSEFVSDETGRLTTLRTTLLVDELTTLFVLEEAGVIGVDAPLTEAESAGIAAGMLDGLKDYDYFTELKIDGMRVRFDAARTTAVTIDNARLSATYELTLNPPLAPRGAIQLALYDPTYFAAIETMGPPTLPASLGACATQFVKFEPTRLDVAAFAVLDALSREEAPDDPRVGARFADRSYILCAD